LGKEESRENEPTSAPKTQAFSIRTWKPLIQVSFEKHRLPPRNQKYNQFFRTWKQITDNSLQLVIKANWACYNLDFFNFPLLSLRSSFKLQVQGLRGTNQRVVTTCFLGRPRKSRFFLCSSSHMTRPVKKKKTPVVHHMRGVKGRMKAQAWPGPPGLTGTTTTRPEVT
jgi:hypothetical protein